MLLIAMINLSTKKRAIKESLHECFVSVYMSASCQTKVGTAKLMIFAGAKRSYIFHGSYTLKVITEGCKLKGREGKELL